MTAPSESTPANPAAWPSLARAAAVVGRAITDQRPICIWGHDDVDGIASVAIMRSALDGHVRTVAFIPPKDNPHYGLNAAVIDQLASDGIGLIITVDSGISSSSEAAYAISKGLQLVITDHHELPALLPQADAVVNPKIREDGAPSPSLSGAAVALYLASLLAGASGTGWLSSHEQRTAWAALATVSDRVPLAGENRAILKAGLPLLARDPVIAAVAAVTGLDLASGLSHRIVSQNLVGLLSSGTSEGFDHPILRLLAGDVDAARIQALWRSRQQWGAQLLDQTEQKKGRLNPDRDLVNVIVDEQLAPDMIGPLAGRLRDATGFPTVVIGIKNGLHVGECRGYEPFDFTAMLRALAHNFVQSGGHKQAAGFTVKPTKLGETLVAIEEYAENHKSLVRSAIPRPEIAHRFDTIADLAAAAQQLAAGAPYGPGNPEPACEIKRFTHAVEPGNGLWLDQLLASPGGAASRTVTVAVDVTHIGKISLRLLS